MNILRDQRAGGGGRRFKRCWMLGAAICAMIAAGQDVRADGIADAVRAALQTNPDVGLTAENRRAVRYELKQAEARYLPTVDFRAATGPEYNRDNTTKARSGSGEWMPKYEFGLTLSQMLFDGWATDANVARQEARDISAARRVRETSQFIGLDAVEAYLESLRQRELTALAEENVRVHEQVLQLVEVKAAGGAATVADVQQAQSRLAAAEATLTEAQTRLRDADATYSRVIGREPEGLSRPVPPYFALPPSVESAIDLALENNPTISVNQADLDVTRKEYEGTLSSFYPTVSLELAANANRNVSAVRGNDYDASALVVMRYNIFRGGEDSYRRSEFAARIGQERQRLNRTVRLTEEEMRVAYNALTSARERIVAQRREVGANAQVRATYRQQFDLGGRNLLELLDSENELFVARGNLISTEFLELFSSYRILASAGVLLTALDVPDLKEARAEQDPTEPLQIDLAPGIDQVIPPNAPGGAPDPMEKFKDSSFGSSGVTQQLPFLDPNAPVLDPNAPVLDPNAPVLNPNAPVLNPNAPVLDPNAPVLDPNAPLLDPNASVLDPNAPVLDPNAPVLDPNAPILNPNAPALTPRAAPAPSKPARPAPQAPKPQAVAPPAPAEPAVPSAPVANGAGGAVKRPAPGVEPLLVPGPGARLEGVTRDDNRMAASAEPFGLFAPTGPAVPATAMSPAKPVEQSAALPFAAPPAAAPAKRAADRAAPGAMPPPPPGWGF